MYEPNIFEEDLIILTSKDVAFPNSFEKVLNHIQATEYSQEDNTEVVQPTTTEDVEESEDEEQVVKMTSNDRKVAKRKKKKYKKKMKKKLKNEQKLKETSSLDKENKVKKLDIEVEYIQESISVSNLVPMYRQYVKVFENFKMSESQQKPSDQDGTQNASLNFKKVSILPEFKDEEGKKVFENFKIPEPRQKPSDQDGAQKVSLNLKKMPKLPEFKDDDDIRDEDEENQQKGLGTLSRRQYKKVNRLSVAELKQLVSRPDVVEIHDVTARDPRLLIHLKAYRNTVPVPRHWCFKAKYLQGKRGIEKPPFDLPDYIKRTGIMEMRGIQQEKEDKKSLKNKMRERVRPKMGKVDIDYKILHEAFFKFQTKPRLTIHGDLYYEGKEHEANHREHKPGVLSAELRTALGMPVGQNAHKIPPPWLIAMQRYGPPKSYPSLKIPGVSFLIPEGCSFGYHAGGWGKPPVNEYGRPIYGDVFGTTSDDDKSYEAQESLKTFMWGEPDLESDTEESEEEEVTKTVEVAIVASGIATPVAEVATSSGIMTELPSRYEALEYIELRKRKIEFVKEQTPLYHVLPEKKVDIAPGSMVASTHMYDIQSAMTNKPLEVEVSLDPSELDLATNVKAMAARYEQRMKDQQSGKNDGSETENKQGQKRKNAQEAKTSKKYKDFKF